MWDQTAALPLPYGPISGRPDLTHIAVPDEGIDLAPLGLVDSQQVVFNLFEQRPANRLFPAGRATDADP